ncbi:MAG: alanine racemase [Clostridia bacterium]|nr:alanine racemase [Clostridia bacterium]
MKTLEVKKDDLIDNLNIIKNKLNGKTEVIAVIKANGMGLGLVEYTKFLVEQEIHFFAVANSEEAIVLRQNEIKENILMMSEVVDEIELETLIKNDVILTVGSLNEKEKIAKVANRLNQKAEVHVKIDTGFARYGFLYNDEAILEAVEPTENVKVTGCFTHFSKTIDEKWTRLQFSRFQNVISKIKEVNPGIKCHCCNSTAFLKYEDMWLDFVRLGSCIQGRVLENPLGLKKIGRLKSEIILIKNIPKGYNISYSNEYTAPHDMRLAVVNVRIYGWF